VYHGWKFDVSGACVDMPSEPPESNFKTKVRATAYPCVERHGLIWTYMGPRETPPPLPDLEPNMLPEGTGSVSASLRACNWLQAIEGDIDTAHAGFLHFGPQRVEDVKPGTFAYYMLRDQSPRYAVADTEAGTMYGGYREAEPDSDYWRIAQFMMPFYSIPPAGVLGVKIIMRAWVPLDDEHTMHYILGPKVRPGPAMLSTNRQRADDRSATRRTGMEMLPNTTDWRGRWRLEANADNDYLIDREVQRRGDSYTGIAGIFLQDQAITESMGAVYDRSHEHLGTSDTMIIRTRQRLLGAVKAFRDLGVAPPGVDDPAAYRVRGGGVVIPRGVDWVAYTEHLRRAFVEHPEIDPAIAGGA
jgi:phenylpropionate dioxygenase-like ring-hydroxylating dioxygenase large terminal subunit